MDKLVADRDGSQHGGADPEEVAAEDDGYHKGLGNRQVQMIAIGGAIGTGLFLGAGSRLQMAGPSLAIVYLVCGVFSFLILRALGELVMHRPTCGSFVSYAREFLGERASFVAGWMSFLNWAMTGIVDITAVALYMHYWGTFAGVPQWVFALMALFIVTSMNMIGVKYFGEMEFWFSLIKVVALSLFLIVGAVILGVRVPVGGHTTGLHLISQNGGFFPHGIMPALVLVQGVVFAYSAIELVGTAAGECRDYEHVVPRAINSVMWRIALFYVGSVVLLTLLLPWTAYRAGTSPFVTFFQTLGVPGIGTIMNIVVLTAALSSLNSGLYSTGRVLRALALGDSAPRFLAYMNRHSVPAGGILMTVAIYLVGGRAELRGAEPGVRDRAQRLRTRHRQHLGFHPGEPDHVPARGAARRGEGAEFSYARRAVHLLAVARLPRRRAGADGIRLPGRHHHGRDHPADRGAPGAGLVEPAPHAADPDADHDPVDHADPGHPREAQVIRGDASARRRRFRAGGAFAGPAGG